MGEVVRLAALGDVRKAIAAMTRDARAEYARANEGKGGIAPDSEEWCAWYTIAAIAERVRQVAHAAGRSMFAPTANAVGAAVRHMFSIDELRARGAARRREYALHPPGYQGAGTWAGLSHREKQVATLVVEGMDRHEIAERLHISTKTYDTHRLRLMGKLGVRNAAELVRLAHANGWL